MSGLAHAEAIDLRLRPPAGAFLDLSLFAPDSGLGRRLRDRGYDLPASFVEQSVDLLREEMSRAGIHAALTAARAPGRLGGVSNAEAAAVADRLAPELIGFVGCLAARPADAIAEIASCVALGALAVGLEPGLMDPPLHADAPELNLVYEALEASGLPVFVTGGDAGPDTSYASPLDLERASARFPRVPFVAVHGGWPYVGEMVAVALRRPNVWVMPDLYWVAFPGHRDYTEASNGILRERMLFASSYPAVNLEQYVARLHADGLEPDAWRAIAWENPQRLLGDRLAARLAPAGIEH
jgi:predicted TIM-barrel fold metal-dependent hydrolase